MQHYDMPKTSYPIKARVLQRYFEKCAIVDATSARSLERLTGINAYKFQRTVTAGNGISPSFLSQLFPNPFGKDHYQKQGHFVTNLLLAATESTSNINTYYGCAYRLKLVQLLDSLNAESQFISLSVEAPSETKTTNLQASFQRAIRRGTQFTYLISPLLSPEARWIAHSPISRQYSMSHGARPEVETELWLNTLVNEELRSNVDLRVVHPDADQSATILFSPFTRYILIIHEDQTHVFMESRALGSLSGSEGEPILVELTDPANRIIAQTVQGWLPNDRTLDNSPFAGGASESQPYLEPTLVRLVFEKWRESSQLCRTRSWSDLRPHSVPSDEIARLIRCQPTQPKTIESVANVLFHDTPGEPQLGVMNKSAMGEFLARLTHEHESATDMLNLSGKKNDSQSDYSMLVDRDDIKDGAHLIIVTTELPDEYYLGSSTHTTVVALLRKKVRVTYIVPEEDCWTKDYKAQAIPQGGSLKSAIQILMGTFRNDPTIPISRGQVRVISQPSNAPFFTAFVRYIAVRTDSTTHVRLSVPPDPRNRSRCLIEPPLDCSALFDSWLMTVL